MPKTPRFPPNAPRVIDILAYPAVQLLDVAGPLQVFTTATQLAAARRAGAHAPRVVSASGPVVTASAGLGLVVAPLPRVGAALDTLLVAGGPGVHDAASDAAVVRWVRARASAIRN